MDGAKILVVEDERSIALDVVSQIQSGGSAQTIAIIRDISERRTSEKHDFAQVDLSEYLAQLTRHALASANAAHITSKLDISLVSLDLQRAVPCACSSTIC